MVMAVPLYDAEHTGGRAKAALAAGDPRAGDEAVVAINCNVLAA
jgi:hypothetical protein